MMLVCVKLTRKYWKLSGLMLCFLFSSGFLLHKQTLSNTETSLEETRTDRHIHNKIGQSGIDDVQLGKVTTVGGQVISNSHEIPQTPRTEVRHIGFLKVHKAASSTMQNMFFRFGLKRNLTFVFTEHPNYFSREYDKHIPLVRPTRRSGYDILCNHGVFNYKLYSSVLPNDTVYIGIIRDPLTVFISAVNYYTQKSQLIRYLGQVPGNKLQNLIRNPEQYDKGTFTYTKNVMARDFGFTPRLKSVADKLQELDKQMKLVLLVEYFDESLILMKRYLNWDMKDILYISNNVYGKGSSVKDLTPNDVQLFRKRNALDYALYDHYYTRFWNQFDQESGDIHEEVINFKRALRLLFVYCNDSNTTDSLVIPKSSWNNDIVITKKDCDYMKMDELEFIKYLRTLQGSELGRKKPRVRVINKGK